VRRAVELRVGGASYERIAEEMGISTGTAFRWVGEALAGLPSESAEELRKLAMLRCEDTMLRLMTLLRAGDTSLRTIDRILQTQAQLLQLHGVAGFDGDTVTIRVGLPAPRSPKPAPQGARAAKP
jgi:transposase-like protein